LVSALRADAARLSGNGDQLEASVEAPAPFPELPAAVEVAAYRIALEALANVSRHAHARTCRVELGLGRDLRIVVADDGLGLGAGREAGVGLRRCASARRSWAAARTVRCSWFELAGERVCSERAWSGSARCECSDDAAAGGPGRGVRAYACGHRAPAALRRVAGGWS
jgi:hypothetical protein